MGSNAYGFSRLPFGMPNVEGMSRVGSQKHRVADT